MKTKFGNLDIEIQNDKVVCVVFNDIPSKEKKRTFKTPSEKNLLNIIQEQIKNPQKNTTLSSHLVLKGTDFQIKVWEYLLKIPVGRTQTYKEIAEKIGHPKAFRAVGNACGKNKIAVLVPCHRAIGNNHLGGYAWGLGKKKELLDFEKEHSQKH